MVRWGTLWAFRPLAGNLGIWHEKFKLIKYGFHKERKLKRKEKQIKKKREEKKRL